MVENMKKLYTLGFAALLFAGCSDNGSDAEFYSPSNIPLSEAQSPTGKVADYEKYLSVIFADSEGYDRCTADNQGKLIGYEDYYYASIVCDKSVWRKAHLGDFIGPKYNPDLTYGMYIDDSDRHGTISVTAFMCAASRITNGRLIC